MKLNIVVESKNFDNCEDKSFVLAINQNPCIYCFLGQGLMCADRKHCRWDTDREIYVKKEITKI